LLPNPNDVVPCIEKRKESVILRHVPYVPPLGRSGRDVATVYPQLP
jgi:hypothetical protein